MVFQTQALPQDVNPEFVKLINGVYYDLCVNAYCKSFTGVRTDCPIERRTYYVEGCGQLCGNCWHKTDSRA